MRLPEDGPISAAMRVLAALGLLTLAGCTTVARVTRIEDPGCRTSLESAFRSILEEEDEKPDVAAALAAQATDRLAAVDIGPRPFVVSSPSGVDFAFFFEKEEAACLLHLLGSSKASPRTRTT
jgi:hypothetical protein